MWRRLGCGAGLVVVVGSLPASWSIGRGRVSTSEPSRVDAKTILTHSNDRYNGVLIDAGSLPRDPREFEARLASSVEAWTKDARRGVWLTLPSTHLELAPVAVKHGFEIHSAAKDSGLQLTKWLPHDTPNTLPAPASSYLGVGCLVLNRARDKMLVVQEKNGVLRGKNFWKMPTGALDAGEGLEEACVRELFEETGVVAAPKGMVLLRHACRYLNGKADVFFVILMELPKEADGRDVEAITIQESEIADAKWIPLDEYFEQDLSALWPAGRTAYSIMNAAIRKAIHEPESVLTAARYSTDASAIYHPPTSVREP